MTDLSDAQSANWYFLANRTFVVDYIFTLINIQPSKACLFKVLMPERCRLIMQRSTHVDHGRSKYAVTGRVAASHHRKCPAVAARAQEQQPYRPRAVENYHCLLQTSSARKADSLGRRVPPSSVEWDVLSGSHDPRVDCPCESLYPVPSSIDPSSLESCGCKAIERMIKVGKTKTNGKKSRTTSAIYLRCTWKEVPFSQSQSPGQTTRTGCELDDSIHHHL